MTADPTRQNLLCNSFLYEACLDWLRSSAGRPEETLEAVTQTSFFAWLHHAGRFADGTVENAALRLGRDDLPEGRRIVVPKWTTRRRSTTLHVASRIFSVGGHTRMLAKWILRDGSANHAVVLTNQQANVPEFFEQTVESTGGTVRCLPPSDSAMARAGSLRQLAASFDRVVLYTHPQDPVPIMAFARPGGPPVAMFNHAHFSFSLGPSVSDLVINTSEYFRVISERSRYARRTAVLTAVPGVAQFNRDPIDKDQAKRDLGIDPSVPVVLSIGQESYYTPCAGYDFFKTAGALLASNRQLQLLVVGLHPESPLVPPALRDDARCRFLGPVVDPIAYYRAADVCLESFPKPSLGGLVEAVVYGEAFPIPVYGESESILRLSQEPVLRYAYRPTDEDDYVQYVNDVVANLADAREQARIERDIMITIDDNWHDDLAELNGRIDVLPHRSCDLPACEMIDSYDTRVLAALEPADMAAQIHRILPFGRAARAHFRAARLGFPLSEGPLRRVQRRAWSGVRSRVLGRVAS